VHQFGNYYIEPSILHKLLDQYVYIYNCYYIILYGFGPICTNLTSCCTKLSILQFVGVIHTHLTSCCSKLSISQLVGLIRTHLTSCCMASAIYSLFFTDPKWDSEVVGVALVNMFHRSKKTCPVVYRFFYCVCRKD
jgi:hypothetical protein